MTHDESLFGPYFIPAMKASTHRAGALAMMAHSTGKGGSFANAPSARSVRRQMERAARKKAKKGGQP